MVPSTSVAETSIRVPASRGTEPRLAATSTTTACSAAARQASAAVRRSIVMRLRSGLP